jgi:hypothetical protein
MSQGVVFTHAEEVHMNGQHSWGEARMQDQPTTGRPKAGVTIKYIGVAGMSLTYCMYEEIYVVARKVTGRPYPLVLISLSG